MKMVSNGDGVGLDRVKPEEDQVRLGRLKSPKIEHGKSTEISSESVSIKSSKSTRVSLVVGR